MGVDEPRGRNQPLGINHFGVWLGGKVRSHRHDDAVSDTNIGGFVHARRGIDDTGVADQQRASGGGLGRHTERYASGLLGSRRERAYAQYPSIVRGSGV